MTLQNCKLTELPKFSDQRGSLSIVEAHNQVPFEIKRVFYLYDMPNAVKRGAHGHKRLQQFIIPIAGSFDMLLDDGKNKQLFKLNNPARGLYIPAKIWGELTNFEPGTVCLVLASDYYDEDEYFRDYTDFLQSTQG